MEAKPFITIITPTYNRAELLGYAIDSVINQKEDIPFSWEMIIVDDGSTDNTKEIVNEYIQKYPKNIFYFYQKNSGIPGCARNIGLENMNKNSDYTIFLDSDDGLKSDTIYSCLKKFRDLENENKKILGLYYLCEDDNHRIIGNKTILGGGKEKYFNYKSYLRGDINIELGTFIKSSIFCSGPKLRFSNKVITESVLWAQMYQYCEKSGLYMYVWDFIGRFYRLEHTSQARIIKTISQIRFKNNAEGNMALLDIISKDLDNYGYIKTKSDLLFKIGINYVLSGNKKEGLMYLKKSLKTKFNILVFIIYIISNISRKFILFIYKLFA